MLPAYLTKIKGVKGTKTPYAGHGVMYTHTYILYLLHASLNSSKADFLEGRDR